VSRKEWKVVGQKEVVEWGLWSEAGNGITLNASGMSAK